MESRIYVQSTDQARWVLLSTEQKEKRQRAHKEALARRKPAHERYGLPVDMWRLLVDNGAFRAYKHQMSGAKKRGIGWEFTIADWWMVWDLSGKWLERGNRSGRYVMARFGDVGPYAVWNVRIATHEENLAEARITTKAKKQRVANQRLQSDLLL
jgi:hypothetical protein